MDVDDVLGILTRTDDDDLHELVALAAAICDCAAAGITVRRGDDYHVPVTHGIAPLVCAADDTFCRVTMTTDGVFTIEDAMQDPRFAEIGWVDGTLAESRFYASAPIYAPGGQMVGRLCVIDPQPRTLTDLQRRTLETLAASATKFVELRLLQADRPATSATRVSEAATTVMSQLAAELSHDLRVPLTSVVACIEMLDELLGDHPDRGVEALISRGRRAADRMMRMLDQNLHVGDGRTTANARAVDLGRVVDQLVFDSAALLEPAGAQVQTDWLPVVRADPDDLYSVLQNLLTNSVKFARPGVPARVRVGSQRIDGGWRITVSDNGVGIPEDRRVDVFSLFSRVDNEVAGHGIGLATVMRIIGSYGGRVGAEAVAEGGTEIWFELFDEPTTDTQRPPTP